MMENPTNLFNLHTHTLYCDGKAEPRSFIEKGIALGFHTLGFSSHAPVPFENTFAIRDEEALSDYFGEIRQLGENYKDRIRVLLALEIDYIPGITRDFEVLKEMGGLDYTIGGVHLVRNPDNNSKDLWFIDGPYQERYDNGLQKVFDGNPRKAVSAYYHQLLEMVATQQPDIIAHLDKIKMHNKDRYFSEQESWYRDLVWKTLRYISTQTSSIVEVNTRGIYKKRCDALFPGPDILEQVKHLNIPVTLNSDAHEPHELNGHYGEAVELLKEIGFKDLTCFEGSRRVSVPIG